MADANNNLAELALKLMAPANKVIIDDNGLPSVMVEIPKMKISDLITGGSNAVHPAFIVNNIERSSIFISKYLNVSTNGIAQSIPAAPPVEHVTFDVAFQACKAKGRGWHLMTAAEYALVALICQKTNFFPWGNNNLGKDYRESEASAIPATYGPGGTSVHALLTGTGATSYSHDNSLSGIFDLNGYPAEWIGGRRIFNGEIQIIPNGQATNNSYSQAYDSFAWRAIDATTGDFVIPNGSGTTENTVKLDATGNNPVWDTEVHTPTVSIYTYGMFKSIQCASGISDAAKETLAAYLLYTSGGNWGSDNVQYNNTASEGMFAMGLGLNSGASDGLASVQQFARISNAAGFRCAYANI